MNGQWSARPCLVTGGAGFVGSHLGEELVKRGARVYILDRWLPRNSYLALSGTTERTEFIRGDIRDLELVRVTLERFEIDTVFHLAAQPLVPMSNILPFETLSINALGTYAMLEAVRTAGCVKRFVFASSGAYYGTTTTDRAIAEDEAPLSATNIYAPSKVAADIAVRCYARIYGLKAACCRFMNTYGPGDTNFSRIIPHAVRNLILQSPYDFGDRDDGTTRLDFIHTSDMANAYITVASISTRWRARRSISAAEIRSPPASWPGWSAACTTERSASRSFPPPPGNTPVIKYLDTGKAGRMLGWRPEMTLEQGVRDTIAWYRRFLGRL